MGGSPGSRPRGPAHGPVARPRRDPGPGAEGLQRAARAGERDDGIGTVRLKDLIEGADSDVQGQATPSEIDIRGLTADSRRVEPGWLFAALPGTRADGRAYIDDALKRGAAAVLVPADALPALARPVPIIRDANPRRRLALIAARFHGAQP